MSFLLFPRSHTNRILSDNPFGPLDIIISGAHFVDIDACEPNLIRSLLDQLSELILIIPEYVVMTWNGGWVDNFGLLTSSGIKVVTFVAFLRATKESVRQI